MRTFKYLESVQYTRTSAVQDVNKEMSNVVWQTFGLVMAGIGILTFMHGNTDAATFFVLLGIFCNQSGSD